MNEPLEIKIEEGIPIPQKAGRALGEKSLKIQRALLKLEVGQSFEIPSERPATLRLLVSRLAKICDYNFVTRTTATGIRIWRIENTPK